VQTFTIQSAFKYDHEEEEVRHAIQYINETHRKEAEEVDEEQCLKIIEKVAARYAECVKALAPMVNEVARYIPPRRARKLHVGLFGYSRRLDGHDTRLPRAIKFCAAMYSLGIPPEILGLSALSPADLAFVRSVYKKFDRDIQDALRFLNEENLEYLPRALQKEIRTPLQWFSYDPNEEYREITEHIMITLREESREFALPEGIAKAAACRRFLG
jgi:phosphoenolpyruvate carboxylase